MVFCLIPVVFVLELVRLELRHKIPEVAVVVYVVVELKFTKHPHTRLWNFASLVGDKLATQFLNQLLLGEDFLGTRRVELGGWVAEIPRPPTTVVDIMRVQKPTVETERGVSEVARVFVDWNFAVASRAIETAIFCLVPLVFLPVLNRVPHNLASRGLVGVVNGENVFAEGTDCEAPIH